MERERVRRIWVVGASSGVGRAAAALAAGAGARVALTARNEVELRALQSTLPDPSRHLVAPADVTCEEDVAWAAERIEEEFGGLESVVYTAGLGCFAPLEETSEQDLRLVLETNLCGAVRVVRSALALLRRGAPPRGIALLGSVSGRRGEADLSIYAASKGALFPLADALREEFAGDGIRVTVVAPGPIDTPFVSRSRGRPPEPAAGLAPETVARELLRSLEGGRVVRHLPGRQALRALLNVLAPSLLDALRRRRA